MEMALVLENVKPTWSPVRLQNLRLIMPNRLPQNQRNL